MSPVSRSRIAVWVAVVVGTLSIWTTIGVSWTSGGVGIVAWATAISWVVSWRLRDSWVVVAIAVGVCSIVSWVNISVGSRASIGGRASVGGRASIGSRAVRSGRAVGRIWSTPTLEKC